MRELTDQYGVVKSVEIPEALICLYKANIVHVRYKKNTTLDVELQERMHKLYRELVGNKKVPFIFSADEGFSITKEARERSVEKMKGSPILCYVLIADNLAYRIIANFYLKINKPKIKHKLFSDLGEAFNWLKLISFPQHKQN